MCDDYKSNVYKKPRYLYLVASLTSVYWAIKSNGSQLGHKLWAKCETVRNEELKMNHKYMKSLLDPIPVCRLYSMNIIR